MEADTHIKVSEIKVDGGMTVNSLLMQIQADTLAIEVVRPAVSETTALGAAYAAGLAVGFWGDLAELRENWRESKRWRPRSTAEDRVHGRRMWGRAVDSSRGWLPQTGS
jgi:glycerol kinase